MFALSWLITKITKTVKSCSCGYSSGRKVTQNTGCILIQHIYSTYTARIGTYTANIRHIYRTYTGYIRHIYRTYTTHIRHIYRTYTEHIGTYTTHIRHIYGTYTAHIHHIYSTYMYASSRVTATCLNQFKYIYITSKE